VIVAVIFLDRVVGAAPSFFYSLFSTVCDRCASLLSARTVVSWLARRGLPRLIAVIIVFAVFVLGEALIYGLVHQSHLRARNSFNRPAGLFGEKLGLFDDYLEHRLTKIPQLGRRQPDANSGAYRSA